MKRLTLIAFIFPAFILAADCGALSAKYQAPNPASKTMAQIERWVNNRVSDQADASTLKECLIAGAADNPNQASYAGK
ncbi:hypothetical protein [Campylobacter troglodytis]|uniref:hypothetical protein n=1 Tax=Campylobacter troglodytis TaxID=654363 RepID=UPI00115AB49F|nr:hypothetical protein [Campylobacter troglodytis]TQR60647.1 hypothetical protein DMC01_04785 [Campylobacter troglodytis]